jgi:hypothetical protein
MHVSMMRSNLENVIKMAGPTGGVQGVAGTLFDVPYASGSWQDKLIEAFAGTPTAPAGSKSI